MFKIGFIASLLLTVSFIAAPVASSVAEGAAIKFLAKKVKPKIKKLGAQGSSPAGGVKPFDPSQFKFR